MEREYITKIECQFKLGLPEIVRCKDCKYATDPRNAWDRTCRIFGVVGDDFFCAKGERKDGEQNG